MSISHISVVSFSKDPRLKWACFLLLGHERRPYPKQSCLLNLQRTALWEKVSVTPEVTKIHLDFKSKIGISMTQQNGWRKWLGSGPKGRYCHWCHKKSKKTSRYYHMKWWGFVSIKSRSSSIDCPNIHSNICFMQTSSNDLISLYEISSFIEVYSWKRNIAKWMQLL